MADTAIADVQRRATEKLPHFVYPPAKPAKLMSAQTSKSLLLVSDNLEKHEPPPPVASGLPLRRP